MVTLKISLNFRTNRSRGRPVVGTTVNFNTLKICKLLDDYSIKIVSKRTPSISTR